MKTIALYSIKGGVGKTAACVNLAYLAAIGGVATLLCDLDPQGSSTFYFRIQPKPKYSSRKFLKGGKWLDKAIRGTDFQGLDLLPADLSYRNLDIQLNGFTKSRQRLRRLLESFKGRYGYVFLDCPPNITLVSENVFEAADAILVPLIPTTLSMLTYTKLYRFFEDTGLDRRKLHPFFSMVEPRKLMHRQTIQETIATKIHLMNTYIPYNADVEKMGFFRQPLMHYRPAAMAALAFAKLWKEIKTHIPEEKTNGS
ncbi:ParA family protein [Desulfosarcina sp.]|uniref:ParA family protein n=1 Tax=Desulfosarcina sp. TaxID=2027861 RepID=UPI0039705144